MNDKTDVRIPGWYWLVAGLAFLWNLFGMMQFVMQFFISEEVLATRPEQIQELIQSPLVNTAFAIAVVSGVLGCIGLLLRKKWALPLFVVSLLAILAQNAIGMLTTDILSVMGPLEFSAQGAVILVACLLIWFSSSRCKKQWLT